MTFDVATFLPGDQESSNVKHDMKLPQDLFPPYKVSKTHRPANLVKNPGPEVFQTVGHTTAHFENDILPAVLAELERIQAREFKRAGKQADKKRPYRGRGVLGDPPRTLGPEETQHWKEQQWAQMGYVAGFVDGEGCVTVVRQIRRDRPNDSARIRVIVVQNDHSVLAFVQNVLDAGGCINALKRQSSQNRQMYQLQYDGWHAVAVLVKLRSLLQRKKAEADVCLRLFLEGQYSRHTGRKPLDPEIINIREKSIRRLQKMK